MTATPQQQTSTDHVSSPGNDGGLGRKMKSRHLVMMSLGSAIGTGLFVGTGAGVAAAGPAVLLSFIVASTLVILVMRMLGEMAAANPNSGAFSVYAEKAMGRTAGSTVGWLWWIQLVVVVAAEATAAAAILNSMWPVLPQWALALVFIAGFTAINLFGVSKFGEMEFWFAILKVAAIVVFLAVGTALLLGLLPTADSPGLGNLYEHGGFMPNGLSGIAAGLLVVIFAFGGTEIVTVAAAETEDPERNVGKAIRTVLWRILVFYIGSVIIMITVLPWNSEELGASPFVAVLTFAGLPGMQTAMGVVIAIALLSALNANLYGASRMIYSLSQRGRASAGLSKLSSKGVPRAAVLASVGFGFAAVVLNYLWPETVLNILLNAVGSTILVIWGSSIVSQIILRRRADRDPNAHLPLKMWAFPYLSYAALAILAGIVALALFDPAARTQLLATTALTVVIALVCWMRARRSGADHLVKESA
ncbi:amino acid permease [Arthrobacter pigmenti]